MRVKRARQSIFSWTAPPLGAALLGLLATLATVGNAWSQTSAEYQVYPLKHKHAPEVEKLLGQMLAGQESTHVVADAQRNQILLRGPADAQQIARQLIESVDQPAPVQPVSKPVVRTYTVDASRLNELADAIRSQYSAQGTVRIAAEPAGSRLLVLAPTEIHEQIAQKLTGATLQGEPKPPARSLPLQTPALGGGPQPPGQVPPQVLEPSKQQFIPVVHNRVDQLDVRIRQVLGSRLAGLPNQSPQSGGYLYSDAAGRRAELRIDPARNGVHLFGPGMLVDQLGRLVYVLDNPQVGGGVAMSVVPLRSAGRVRVRQAVQPRGGEKPVRQPIPFDTPGGAVPIPTHPEPDKSSQRAGHVGVELVSGLFQPAEALQAGPQEGPQAMPAEPLSPAEEQEIQERLRRLRELGEGVEIETLPDLDVLILRGRQRDVEEMRRLIEEIERLSAEAEPIIDIYHLKHIGNEALADLIEQIEDDLLGGRQGRVSIVPLVKPNALLLIGWGEAMEAVKQLIARLDRNVPPGAQLRVFRLQHAPAAGAASTIEQFFTGRQGLGTEVQVTADIRTNSLIVYASPRDMEEVALLVQRIDVGTTEAVNQVRVFTLENSLAADLADTLESAIRGRRTGAATASQRSAVLELLTVDAQGAKLLKSGILNDVTITPDVRMNTIIVSAPAESMDLIAALIRQLDSPTAVAQIKVFSVVNGDANAMVRMLQLLLPSQTGAASQLRLPAAEGESALTPLRFSVDPRTNSIIAVGSPGDLAIIEALLLRLDEQDVEQRKTTVYRLRNAPAIDVAVAINEFLRSQRQLLLAAPGTLSPFQQIESEVVVVPEPVSNALILSATPRFYEDIMTLVEDLDAEPPQVLIQVLIAEIELQNFDEFGVELGLQDSLLFDRSLLGNLLTTTSTTQTSTPAGVVTRTDQTIRAASLTPGFDFNNNPLGNSGSDKSLATSGKVAGQGLTSFSLGRISELGYGGLVLSASSESVSILIRALQECRRMEVLARPQVMTLDNQPAFIQVGQRVPRISGTAINQVGQVNQLTLENVGLILGVTPRVSPEGMVVMEIDAERSELGAISEGIPVAFSEDEVIRSPTVNLTMAQTTVSAADGETVVLGGLITKDSSEIRRRVPWLAEIPVLGNLFRFDTNSVRRRELLIILTPHVVRTPADAEKYKKLEAARMHWCLADVHEIHGPTGLCDDYECPICRGNTKVIYPDADPRGVMPGEVPPGVVLPPDLKLTPPLEEIPAPQPSIPGAQPLPPGAFEAPPEDLLGTAPQPPPRPSLDGAKAGEPNPLRGSGNVASSSSKRAKAVQ